MPSQFLTAPGGRCDSAIRDYYHRIWIYGDPTVYDTVREYGFPPDIAAMVRYSSYLIPRDAEGPGLAVDSDDNELMLPPRQKEAEFLRSSGGVVWVRWKTCDLAA